MFSDVPSNILHSTIKMDTHENANADQESSECMIYAWNQLSLQIPMDMARTNHDGAAAVALIQALWPSLGSDNTI